MKIGWWQIKCTIDGEELTPAALSQESRDRIAKLIKDGYHAGEIIEDDAE